MKATIITFAVAALAVDLGRADVQSLTTAQVKEVIAKIPSTPPTNANLFQEAHYTVAVAVVENRTQPGEVHEKQDRVFYVLDGAGELRIGGYLQRQQQASSGEAPRNQLQGYRSIPLAPGTVISVPRGTPYQFAAEHSKVSFLVVRITED